MVVKGGDGKWSVIGLISFGRQCGLRYSPDVYTRVTSYLDFIQSNCKSLK